MTLPLRYFGDLMLRRRATPIANIDASLRNLIDAMVATMSAERGCGLAAPQVGEPIRLFVVRASDEEDLDEEDFERLTPRVFINPRLFDPSEETSRKVEGCLSIPGINAAVERPRSVHVEYLDQTGQMHSEKFEGFIARVIMHENDHLNGRLFIDRLSPKEKAALGKNLKVVKRRFATSGVRA